MNTIPAVTIIARHSADCAHRDEPEYKRCNCWKSLRWHENGKTRWKATKQRTWAGAERKKREWEDERDPAKHGENPTLVTVREAVDTFMQEKEGQNLSATVVGKYRRELERLHAYLETAGVFQLHTVTLPHLTGFRSTWTDLYPQSLTRSKVQERLKGFFKYATLAYNLRRNPADGLTSIRVESSPTLPLTPEEYQRLLDTIPQVFSATSQFRARMMAVVQLMRWSGLAIRDALCLERLRIQQDANGVTRVATSRAKTGVHVRVPIPAEVAEALDAVANGNPKYIFWSGVSVPDTITKNYQSEFRKLFDKAKLTGGYSVSHRLRDTAAVEWLKSGLSLFEVSKLLGHTSTKTTEKHYAPWVQGLQDRVDQLVMAAWKKPSPEK